MERRRSDIDLELPDFDVRFEHGGLVIIDRDPLFGKPRVEIKAGENMADVSTSIIYTGISELAEIVNEIKRYLTASHDVLIIRHGKIYVGNMERKVVTKIEAIHGRKIEKFIFIYKPTIPIF